MKERLTRRWRIGILYLTLVVLPLVFVVIFVGRTFGDPSESRDTVSEPAGVARLLLAIVVIVGLCKLAGKLAQRLRQPAVIGEITAGILLGPSLLGLVSPQAYEWLFPDQVLAKVGVLAQLGAVLFVFLAGSELNVRLLRGSGLLAVMVSNVGVALPLCSGVLLAMAAYSTFAPPGVDFGPFALFLGVAMSISALPVMARMLADAGLTNTRLATVALSSALIDDITAWCLLAVVISMLSTGVVGGAWFSLLLSAAIVLLLMFGVRPLLARLLRRPWMDRDEVAATLTLVLMFLSAIAMESVGVHAIFGAFVFGLALPRDSRIVERTRDVVGGLTGVLLLPLFFAITGVNTNIGMLGLSVASLSWFLLFLTVAFVGKLGGSALAARTVGETWHESIRIGLLMNCRGLTELVVLNIGLHLGVLTPELFTILVLVALISTAMASPALKTRPPRPEQLPPTRIPDLPLTSATSAVARPIPVGASVPERESL